MHGTKMGLFTLGFEECLSLLVSEKLICRESRKAEHLVKQIWFRLSTELSKQDKMRCYMIVIHIRYT